MGKFTDSIVIMVRAGHGGKGAVSFRREKYEPRGGPDGGDGGRGGDVVLCADRRYYNLSHLFKDRIYKAKNGGSGQGGNRHGKDGDNLLIPVPPGTQILDTITEDLLADLTDEGQCYRAAGGGIGGRGNAFFKSSTHQTPRFSQPGMPGEELHLKLDLKLIADIGLIGLPNAGKSTLLARITNAKPKIAGYPFTTLIPNLGVIHKDDGRIYRIADIPGIIEGAHRGQGLGLSFLQHIERVKVMLYLIDVTGDDIPYTLNLLRNELDAYNKNLKKKPGYILLTKIDLVTDEELALKKKELSDENVLPISSAEGDNIDTLLQIIDRLMESENAA